MGLVTGVTENHYVRGPQGRAERRSGPAIGVDLATVLSRGLPPLDIAFALLAGAMEAVAAATRAGEFHGDIGVRHVFVDETGAVAVEGFGVSRLVTAPGAPGPAADVYGLARLALVCLGSTLPLEAADPAAHDAAVGRALARLDLAPLAESDRVRMVSLLRSALAYDPNERPSVGALAVPFVAGAAPGFPAWCAAAIDGGGARRVRRPAPPAVRPQAPSPPLALAPVVGLLVGVVLIGGALVALVSIVWTSTWGSRPRGQPSLPPPPAIAAPSEVTLTVSGGPGAVQGCVAPVAFVPGVVVLRPPKVPATCTVWMAGTSASFEVVGSGSLTCRAEPGGPLVCDKTRVP